MMVQAAQLSPLDDASLDWQLRSAWFWSVFGQRQMGAPLMIIIRISGKVMVQRPLAENDHVIQALAADGADEPFDVRPLPRRPRRGQDLFDSHCLHSIDEFSAEDPIDDVVTVSRRLMPSTLASVTILLALVGAAAVYAPALRAAKPIR